MASKPRKPIDLGLDNYNELFMNEQERMENRLPRIYEIPLSEIDEFPNHPFQVRMDEDMDQLMESVKERGVITPVTLRKKEDGRYETVSGHRRIYQRKEQAVKRRLCAARNVKYLTYSKTETTEKAAQEARSLFQRMNIYIRSDLQNDILAARQYFQALKDQQR